MAQKIVINNTGSTPKSYINESKTTLVNVKDLDKILQAIAGFGLKYQISNNTLEVDLDDIGGVDGVVTTKGTQTLENKTIDLADNNVINQIEVTYEQLTTLIASNSLKKGNKYLITDFQETWTDFSGLVAKDIEPIVITASGINTLGRIISSIANPSDYVEYDYKNSLITGSIKGVILLRKDTRLNIIGYGTTNSQSLLNMRLSVLGNNHYNNTFSEYFYYNNIGINCGVNYFSNSCSHNIIGQDFYGNMVGSGFQYNDVGDNVYYCVFGNNYKYNSFQSSIQNINFTSTPYASWQTHLQANYPCKIFKNPSNILCLQYTNNDGQTVTLTAE